MLAVKLRTFRALTATGALVALSTAAQAQFYDPCNTCAPPVTVMANPCPCMQPVTTMEERQVHYTAYRDEEKVVQKPVIRTVMEERDVTTYQTVNETRTAEVPGVAYQQCTECQQVTQNRSYWQTYYQPVPKVSPCQYDPRPGFAGAFNRAMYSSRMAFTPNYIPRRQFVPNVVAYNVPVTRTVAVPTSRTVTYNVAKVVPVTEKRQVAVQRLDYENVTVMVKVPYTDVRTVQVPTTRWAMVDSFGGGSVSAARPTPSRAAQAESRVQPRSADATGENRPEPQASDLPGNTRPLSYPRPADQPVRHRDLDASTRPAPSAERSVSSARPVPSAVRVAGWRPSRHVQPEQVTGPEISVAAN